MTVETRPAIDSDGLLISEWWRGRGLVDPRPTLPPLGSVGLLRGEVVAMIWAYEAEGCPVAFVDWMVTRPGLTMAEARTVLRATWAKLEGMLAYRGVREVRLQFHERALVREAENLGFEICGVGVINMAKKL